MNSHDPLNWLWLVKQGEDFPRLMLRNLKTKMNVDATDRLYRSVTLTTKLSLTKLGNIQQHQTQIQRRRRFMLMQLIDCIDQLH